MGPTQHSASMNITPWWLLTAALYFALLILPQQRLLAQVESKEYGGTRFDFGFRPRLGEKAKSAPSVLYDYYNPESRAVAPPAVFMI